jgi:hypothetical protein
MPSGLLGVPLSVEGLRLAGNELAVSAGQPVGGLPDGWSLEG